MKSECSVKTERFEMYGGALIMYVGNLNWNICIVCILYFLAVPHIIEYNTSDRAGTRNRVNVYFGFEGNFT